MQIELGDLPAAMLMVRFEIKVTFIESFFLDARFENTYIKNAGLLKKKGKKKNVYISIGYCYIYAKKKKKKKKRDAYVHGSPLVKFQTSQQVLISPHKPWICYRVNKDFLRNGSVMADGNVSTVSTCTSELFSLKSP
jgi:hypothetical protein